MPTVREIATTPTGTTPPSTDELLLTIQDQLLSSAGLISSSDTNIETAIKKAISGVEQRQVADATRIEGTFGRETAFERGNVSAGINEQLEGGRGFAVNIGALRELVRTGDKRLDDLEDRKQELLLQGSAAAAEKIATLQLQELTLQQEGRQRTFQNLLQLAGVAAQSKGLDLQSRGLDLQTRSQNFTERSTIASLAAEFGVPVSENETIESITTKVAPLATQKRKLELAKMKAEIAESDARRREALSGIIDINNFSSENVDALAMARRSSPGVIDAQIVRSPELMAKVINRQAEMEKVDVKDTTAAWEGRKADLLEALVNNPALSPATRANLQSIVDEEWAKRPAQPARKRTNLPNILLGLGEGITEASFDLAEFITGQER